jgi:hypothetical protein
MKNLAEVFEQKYGFDASTFIKEIGVEYFDTIKRLSLDSVIITYADKKGYKIPEKGTKEFNDFLISLLEAIQFLGEKFPQNQKITLNDKFLSELEISPVNCSKPKSKGILEDFKNIVGSDDLRPNMQGVYVDDGKLIATDAHKIVIFENDDFNDSNEKIIDLKAYLGTKGAKKIFIDGKFPNYKQVIPFNYDQKVKNVDLFALYCFFQSCVAMKKLQTNYVFSARIKLGEETFGFNPILFQELLTFLLAKGFEEGTIEYSLVNRAVLIQCGGENLGLIMPLLAMDEAPFTKVYTIDEITSEFGGQLKSKPTTKTKSQPQPKVTKRPTTKNLTYTKFTGKISETVYISRREIAAVILKNGDEIAGNQIVDGIYKIK